MTNQLPDPAMVGKRIAALHQKSRGRSDKFGFPVTTYDGKLPQRVDWDSSWPSFFANLLQGVAELDREVNEPWIQLENVLSQTTKNVIPRLLGNLKSVEPCLIHGDLWEGNIGTDVRTGDLYIFDSCAYYAHHEMEIGMWRVDHHKMKAKAYKREYLRHIEISDPVDEFDDRNRLYSVKTKLMYSAHVPGSNVRQQAYNDLEFLVKKFPSSPTLDQSNSLEKGLVPVENLDVG